MTRIYFTFLPKATNWFALAGLLACSALAAFPPDKIEQWQGCQNIIELTATGIAPVFHRIPYYGYPQKEVSPPKHCKFNKIIVARK